MTARITITRVSVFRSVGVLDDIKVDGAVVGRALPRLAVSLTLQMSRSSRSR